MNKRFKLTVLVLVIVLLISSMSVLLTSCNEGEQEPKCYYLSEAYELGLISYDELKSILYHYGARDNDFGEGFEPIPLNPSELSEELEEQIIKDYEAFIARPQDQEKMEGWILKYLGTYKNGIVLLMNDSRGAVDMKITGQIADLSYVIWGGRNMVFWIS